jgi:ATP-binding cassette subfamily B protein
MISLIREIIRFSGKYAARIRAAFLFSLLKSICAKAPYMVAVILIWSLLEKSADR